MPGSARSGAYNSSVTLNPPFRRPSAASGDEESRSVKRENRKSAPVEWRRTFVLTELGDQQFCSQVPRSSSRHWVREWDCESTVSSVSLDDLLSRVDTSPPPLATPDWEPWAMGNQQTTSAARRHHASSSQRDIAQHEWEPTFHHPPPKLTVSIDEIKREKLIKPMARRVKGTRSNLPQRLSLPNLLQNRASVASYHSPDLDPPHTLTASTPRGGRPGGGIKAFKSEISIRNVAPSTPSTYERCERIERRTTVHNSSSERSTLRSEAGGAVTRQVSNQSHPSSGRQSLENITIEKPVSLTFPATRRVRNASVEREQVIKRADNSPLPSRRDGGRFIAKKRSSSSNSIINGRFSVAPRPPPVVKTTNLENLIAYSNSQDEITHFASADAPAVPRRSYQQLPGPTSRPVPPSSGPEHRSNPPSVQGMVPEPGRRYSAANPSVSRPMSNVTSPDFSSAPRTTSSFPSSETWSSNLRVEIGPGVGRSPSPAAPAKSDSSTIIQELHATLERREREIELLKAQLADLNTKLEQREQSVQLKSDRIEELEQFMNFYRSHNMQLQQELKGRDRDLENLSVQYLEARQQTGGGGLPSDKSPRMVKKHSAHNRHQQIRAEEFSAQFVGSGQGSHHSSPYPDSAICDSGNSDSAGDDDNVFVPSNQGGPRTRGGGGGGGQRRSANGSSSQEHAHWAVQASKLDELAEEIKRLRVDLNETRDESNKQKELFEREKLCWLEEKEIVMRYQRHLQDKYGELCRQNESMQRSLVMPPPGTRRSNSQPANTSQY